MERLHRLGRWVGRTISAQAFGYCAARREIAAKMQDCDEDMEIVMASQHELAAGLTEPILEQFENRDHERRQFLQAKAGTNLLAVSLAVAIATSLLGLSSAPVPHCPRTTPALLTQIGYASIILGWVYFTLGGLFAFLARDIRGIYVLVPRDHLDLKELDLRAKRLFNLKQNQRLALILTNALAVSFAAIRNGIILFAAGTVAIAIRLFG